MGTAAPWMGRPRALSARSRRLKRTKHAAISIPASRAARAETPIAPALPASQIHSGGLLRGTPHCVVAPRPELSAGISRETFAVFMQARRVVGMSACNGDSVSALCWLLCPLLPCLSCTQLSHRCLVGQACPPKKNTQAHTCTPPLPHPPPTLQPKWDTPLDTPPGVAPKDVGIGQWRPGLTFGEHSERTFDVYYKK